MCSTSDITADKASIRLRMISLRSALRVPEDTIAGEVIIRRIIDLPEFRDSIPAAAVIGLFSPIRMEVDLLANAGLMRQGGLQTALPRMYGDSLVFSKVQDMQNLRPGVFGIMEPQPEAEEVLCRDLFAVCLPGLAFDSTGARLGYGKGYYDHYLESCDGGRRPILIGVGYDFQLIDSVPQEAHDRRLDYIVTPSQTIKVRAQERQPGGTL